MGIKWNNNNTISVEIPRKPKKITGTRFASILGYNVWSTPFEMWCAITKTYEKPFEDTIYTIAGKTIEPKQIQYLNDTYGLTLVTPENMYGKDYFKKTYGDFFKEHKIFGGMWDSLASDGEGNTIVIEFKTTGRVEDWADEIPLYYALQASLYAYLLGTSKVSMVATFLNPLDYEAPELFKVDDTNTIMKSFDIYELFPDFEEKIKCAEYWWTKHVETGISPVYDEKRDGDILKELRKNNVETTDITNIISRAEVLETKIKAIKDAIKEEEKELKELQEIIKDYGMKNFRDGDNKVDMIGNDFVWTLSKTTKVKADEQALKNDNLFEKYSTVETTLRLTKKEINND